MNNDQKNKLSYQTEQINSNNSSFRYIQSPHQKVNRGNTLSELKKSKRLGAIEFSVSPMEKMDCNGNNGHLP